MNQRKGKKISIIRSQNGGKLCQKLDETDNEARNSGAVFYTKPYNYLVSRDRRQIMDFLFWIGINFRRNF